MRDGKDEVEVEKVTAVNDITVTKGEEVKLPETVEVTLSDDTKKDVKVEWNTKDIDFNEVKTYDVTGTIVLGEEDEFTISDELKEVIVKVTVKAEELELKSSALSGEDLQLTFNRELTEEELENVVEDYLRFQVTRVFRVDGNPVKMGRETAKGKGLSEAKDLTLDEVIAVYVKTKDNNSQENQGGWGSKFNSEKLNVTQNRNGLVTIKVLDDLFTHEEMTSEDKINSKNALIEDKGYKIGVHVGDKEYKIQLNTIDKGPVTGKFIEVK